MFAFAVWDKRRRQVVLARDRLGIKPLVYAWDGMCLSFGSEIKAILADPAVRRRLDSEGLRDYFTYLYVPGPRTIFDGIKKLPPASYLVCSLDGGAPVIHQYWRLRMEPDHATSESEWIARLDELLHETVKLHTISDVPIGAFLSGGLDSSSVVACMSRNTTSPIRTFSIGFDDADFDELRYARLVAARLGTDHVEMVVKPDVINLLPRLAWQFDEPFGDASAVPTYCVSKITREHVTVALSGDGGDENFAGYPRYSQALALHRRLESFPASLVKPILGLAARCLPREVRGRGFLELLGMPPIDRYFRMMTYHRHDTLAALLEPDVAAAWTGSRRFHRLASEAGTLSHLSLLQFLDIHHYLPEDILTKVDRTSMLTSLETRVPLLDHVLVEYVATIPETLKHRAGVGKYILKQAMRPYLPEEILHRRKMGFGVPLAQWFRKELRDFAMDLLLTARARQRGIIRPRAVEQLLASHLSGQRDRSAQIWSLICFELWCRTWFDR